MQSHSLAGSRQRPRLAAAAARSTARSRGRAPPAAAYQPRSTPISSTDSDVSDIINLAKHRMARKQQAAEVPQGPLGDFLHKVHLAWRIFFPEQQRELTPKEEGKQRLRMILVADRVGMNEVTMEAMRERIIGAVSPYVEIESPELVEVAVTTDVELGAIYSVAVPVKRVRPSVRVPMNADGEFELAWDPHSDEADPASQFPYGT
ncbi:chloroplast division site-determinant [Micractinium conductrix]|uniref:Chloroplast division site-determinant n=1 Tax=Micractinium conductrix TaxID=554055 RepID=A0A2P6VQ33_9CHLO|nr:chloroplast division site-determinant [Micractinium conductrix]|eukprot:PSC76208.1 chloroplast division site-determinant [Micractinium conductrix]